LKAANLIRSGELGSKQPTNMARQLRQREVGHRQKRDDSMQHRAAAQQGLGVARDREAPLDKRLSAWNDTLNESEFLLVAAESCGLYEVMEAAVEEDIECLAQRVDSGMLLCLTSHAMACALKGRRGGSSCVAFSSVDRRRAAAFLHTCPFPSLLRLLSILTRPNMLQSPAENIPREFLRVMVMILSLEECAALALATLNSSSSVAPLREALDLNEQNDPVEGLANQVAALLVVWNEKLQVSDSLLRYLNMDGEPNVMFEMVAIPMARESISRLNSYQ